jgi:beta-phosphoglucomutase-like phosphatase (HAD superfamily)
VLEHAVGTARAADFAVFAGDIVPRKKPSPDIYLHALRELALDPADAVVVEDSENGLRASLGAGLATVVTVSSYTAEENFDGAALVVTSLGDDAEPARVLADPLGLGVDDRVHLADLSTILDRTRKAPR